MSTIATDFVVRVRGRPAPKGSRSYGVTKQGKLRSWPASKYEERWIVEVANATREAKRHLTAPDPPYEVELVFHIAPAVKRPTYEWPSQHDLDKLVRSTIDGLVRAGAMIDDRHVSRLVAEKRWASEESEAGVEIALVQHAT